MSSGSLPAVPPRRRLGDILVQAGVIDELQLRSALAEQKRWGGPLGKILVSLRLCTEDALVQALSTQLNMTAVKLDSRTPDDAALRQFTAQYCQQNHIFPFAFTALGKFLDVAMADPTDMRLLDELRVRTKTNPRPFLAGPHQIETAIRIHYLGEVPTKESGVDSLGIGFSAPIGAAISGDKFSAVGTGRYETVTRRTDALEARCQRNEQVLRALLRLLVDKGICTREELKKTLETP